MKINNMIVMHKMNESGQVDERIVASEENVTYFKSQGYINTEDNPATAGQKVISIPKVLSPIVPYVKPVVALVLKKPWWKRAFTWLFKKGVK
jgi:hypothetical protein